MNCLKCGRETQDDHTFCDNCLESMKEYPVRPGTAVVLPRHRESAFARKSKRHTPPSLKDQNKKLKKQRRSLRITVFFLILLLLAVSSALIYVSLDQTPKPGQNYVVVETSAPQ